MPPKTFRVAVTQHEPVWLDLDATVEKTIKIIGEARERGAKLVAFPECWVRTCFIILDLKCLVVEHVNFHI